MQFVLCDDCNSNGSKYSEYVINESFQYEQEHSTSEVEEGNEDAITGHAHHADEEQEDQNDGEEHNDNSNDIEQSSEKQDTTYRVFVKNKQNTSETCKKYTRKILNGVRCTREDIENELRPYIGRVLVFQKTRSRTQRKNFTKKTNGLVQHARSQRILVKRTPMNSVHCANVKIRK